MPVKILLGNEKVKNIIQKEYRYLPIPSKPNDAYLAK